MRSKQSAAAVRLRGWFFLALALALTLGGWTATTLRADTTGYSGATEITSLPCTINTPGVYYLNRNFALNITNANAITVNAVGVTLDLNGHTLSDLAAGSGVAASGIYSPNATRLTVRNGTIRGFTYGIFLNNPADCGVLIENMRLLDATYAGVGLSASGSVVRHCQISRIGGSTYSSWPNGVGVLVFGSDSSVQDCDISELSATNAAYATDGIYANSATGLLFVNNRISGAQNGIYIDGGADGKYRDNLCAASVGSPYTGGTDAGNN